MLKMIALTYLLAISFSQIVLAEGLLESCPRVIDSKSYHPLKQYFLDKKSQGNYCQRLNNYEFVYTNDSNFHYCNFKSKDVPCSENRLGHWYPSLESLARFSGENGKKFSLFKTSHLSRGVYSSTYHAFLFVPKTEESRGYKILGLKDVGEHNGSYSDGGQACDNLGKGDRATELIDKSNEYVILNEGKSNVGIRFTQKVTSCETQESSTQMVEYIWSGSDFVRTVAENK